MPLTTEQREWLTLHLVPGVGSTLFIRLLARFSKPRNVLRASEAELREVVGPKLAQRIRQYGDTSDVDTQARLLDQYHATLHTMEDAGYPPMLAEIYDPPLVLFARGTLHTADNTAIGIVGTRNPSAYGARMAERLGAELAARGITVVSGLALGVDAAAHRGALEAGGRTLAVLGCGVDHVYPAENAELMHKITHSGAVLSPFAMGVKPSRGHFPYRNRIISGLSLGTVVVEAPPGSGSLITARNAAEQGREVFAVPGHAGDRNALGPHSLLREGAKLVESVDDIVAEIEHVSATAAVQTTHHESEDAPMPEHEASAAPGGLSEGEKDVFAALGPDGSFVDEIAMACRIPVSEALSTLTLLELKGVVRQHSGKRFAPR